MTLKDLHELWVKTGYPSRTEIRKAIEGLLAEQSLKANTEAGLREEINRLTNSLDYYKTWHVANLTAIERNGKIVFKLMVGDKFIINIPIPHSPNPPIVEADGEKGLFEAISELANCRGRRVSTKELRATLDKFRGGK